MQFNRNETVQWVSEKDSAMDGIFVGKTYFSTGVWSQLSRHADRCLPNLVMRPDAELPEKTL
jgi:hypothetical protein